MTGKAEAAPTCSAKYCKGCGHYRGGTGAWTCEYLLDVGHRRPCPPGEGCTEHTKHPEAPKRQYVNPMAPARKPGRPPKKRPDCPDKIINEEDEIMENKPEGAGETPEQKIEEVAEKAAELSAARFEELLKKTPVVVADNDEGMTVEQLASLFANMGKVGQADRVTVGGAPVRGVVVTLRYNAKNGDGPAGMTVELEV